MAPSTPPTLRGLHALALVEALSLLALVGNLLTVGDDDLPALLGPLHGLCWLLVIALSFGLGLPRRTAWWSVLPGAGGLVVWWRTRAGGAGPAA
jgi:hypothetical protein